MSRTLNPDRTASFASTRFSIKRRLGQGSVGVVYLAQDNECEREVAIKTLRTVDPLPLFRFKQEFRALADVHHPNLVRLHELICEDGQWFFTMEAIDGVDFLTYAHRHPERRQDALVQLVRGIDALHTAGKLHRDVKPTNVLVTRQHRVVLLDFGLVTDLEVGGFELGDRQRVCGTAGYMAPEQAAAQRLTPACDFYSVGAMLFEALTGDLPFVGEVEEVLREKRRRDGPAPHTVVKDVDPLLDRLTTDLLRRDPHDRPTADIIFRRLGAATIDETLPPRARTPAVTAPNIQRPDALFVGRQAQLERLRDAHERAHSGSSAVAVVVSGESGIGKSELVRRFLDDVPNMVLAGRCYERENVPFKAIDPIVDALCHHLMLEAPEDLERRLPHDTAALATVFPVLCRSEPIERRRAAGPDIDDPQELRGRAFQALRELFQQISGTSGLVIYLEDVQWADVDSAAVLHAILRPPNPPTLLLVACCRDGSKAAPFLSTLRNLALSPKSDDALDLREVGLGPMPLEEAEALAEALLAIRHAPIDSRRSKAKTIAAEASGHPFFVAELVRHAIDEGVVGGPDLGLHVVLDRRIERLKPSARRFLEIVAMAGHPLDRRVAARAADIAPEDRETIPMLVNAQLIRAVGTEGEDLVETAHDRIRDHVTTALPPDAIASYHRRLAAELERTNRAEPEALATHYLGYGRPDRAADLFARAGRRAFKAFAFDRSARLYTQAIAADPIHPRIGRRHLRLATALANAGRGAAAAQAYLGAARHSDASESIVCKRRAAEQYLRSGHVDEGLALIEEVLALVGMPVRRNRSGAMISLLGRRLQLRIRGTGYVERKKEDVPAAQLARIDLAWSGALGLGMVDVLRAYDFQTAHLLAALDAGEPYRVARALVGEALNLAAAGGKSRQKTRRVLLSAERIATRIDHPHAIGLVQMAYGMTESLVGHWARGVRAYDQALAIFSERCAGVAWERDTTEHMRLWALAYLGDFPALRHRVEQLSDDARERNDRYALSLLSTGLPNLRWLMTDDVDAASDALAEGMGRWSQRGFHLQHYNHLLAQTHIYLYCGQAELAHRHLEAQWRRLEKSYLLEVQQVRIEALHLAGRVALAAADSSSGAEQDARLEQATRLARRIEKERMSWGAPLSRLLAAGVAARRGRIEEAVAGFADASGKLAAADMLAYANAARAREGQLMGGDVGRRLDEDARVWLANAGVQDPRAFVSLLVP